MLANTAPLKVPQQQTPATRPQAAPSDPNSVQKAYLTRHIGRVVRMRLLDGKAFSGKLLTHDQYSLLIEVGEDARLVFKHAIAVLSETTSGEGN